MDEAESSDLPSTQPQSSQSAIENGDYKPPLPPLFLKMNEGKWGSPVSPPHSPYSDKRVCSTGDGLTLENRMAVLGYLASSVVSQQPAFRAGPTIYQPSIPDKWRYEGVCMSCQ